MTLTHVNKDKVTSPPPPICCKGNQYDPKFVCCSLPVLVFERVYPYQRIINLKFLKDIAFERYSQLSENQNIKYLQKNLLENFLEIVIFGEPL